MPTGWASESEIDRISCLDEGARAHDRFLRGGRPTLINLKTAVDLTAKNTKIAKKDSYEWIA